MTQAGRGGMEWLGVRGPSWASPYSAQATAALKDAFTTQWGTIRDYGFAHPEIVPYVNQYPVGFGDIIANYQMCEYAESMRTNGLGYFIIDYYLNNDSAIDAIFSGKTMSDNRDMLFGANNAAGNCEAYSVSGTGFMIREAGSGDKRWDATALKNNVKARLYQDPSNPNIVTLANLAAGTESSYTMTRGNIAATTKLYLGTIARAATTLWNDGLRFYAFDIKEGTEKKVSLIPVYSKVGGNIGLFDVVNDKFYPNAGTGTLTKGSDIYYPGQSPS